MPFLRDGTCKWKIPEMALLFLKPFTNTLLGYSRVALGPFFLLPNRRAPSFLSGCLSLNYSKQLGLLVSASQSLHDLLVFIWQKASCKNFSSIGDPQQLYGHEGNECFPGTAFLGLISIPGIRLCA